MKMCLHSRHGCVYAAREKNADVLHIVHKIVLDLDRYRVEEHRVGDVTRSVAVAGR